MYTPDYLVKIILDFGGYTTPDILCKHVIDNSCGDGAFLTEIALRYCTTFLQTKSDLSVLKDELQTYIHGIELDTEECQKCIANLNKTAEFYGIYNVTWDIQNADTLTIEHYNGRMDFVFGNPPYVRVHNLDTSYDAVKKIKFAEKGMTDLFIVFFEIGFNMLSTNGCMSFITPSSWLSSQAGKNLRTYILHNKNLSGLIDLEHFQPFNSTTYTLISKFLKGENCDKVKYYTFNGTNHSVIFNSTIPLQAIEIGGNFYLASEQELSLLRKIRTTHTYKYVTVKNGFATLADKIFINDFSFSDCIIDILKASTGKWSKCIFPYDEKGNPLSEEQMQNHKQAYQHLLKHKDLLTKKRDIKNYTWFLFGRTQAIRDVAVNKYAINTIIKNKNSIHLEIVAAGKGVYSGLYILTDIDWEIIKDLIISDDFICYIKMLKNYKSGGYYTYSSKDLEQYLNYKLSEKHGQSRLSKGNLQLF